MARTSEQWIAEYQSCNAYWLHDGNPLRPHAELTSGKHSNGFFNSELVMEDPLLLSQAVADLCELYFAASVYNLSVDRVVGPAMGAITIAHELARYISSETETICRRAYTVPVGEGANKKMIFDKTTVRPGEHVLLCEDVITTGGSSELSAQAVIEKGSKLVPYICTLVNRSGEMHVHGRNIIALIDKPMPQWNPDDCPLCKAGSVALRPKHGDNWSKLNAIY